VFIAGLAAVERLRSEQSLAALSAATACAGLDVGEFAALVFAGVLGFEDALRLVQVRESWACHLIHQAMRSGTAWQHAGRAARMSRAARYLWHEVSRDSLRLAGCYRLVTPSLPCLRAAMQCRCPVCVLLCRALPVASKSCRDRQEAGQ